MIIKIFSTSRDMVGDVATIRAEVHEQRAGFTRVRDTIEIVLWPDAIARQKVGRSS